MYKGERESLLSTSTLNSTNGKEMVSQMENGLHDPFSLLNSEKAEQETIQLPLCQGLDNPLIKFSEALTNLTKALRQATVEKASAKAEAADWKHKYEIERARNLQLEQKGIRDLEEQALWSNENRKQSELCSQNHEIIVHEVLQDCEPDFESSATGHNKMVEKASFMLEWYCKGEKCDSQKHDVVSFKKGNISTTGRSSKQISLKWKAPPQTALILTKPNSTSAQNLCLEMIRWLKEQKKLHIIVEPRVKAELLAESSYYGFTETWKDDNAMLLMHTKVDLVVTLGGDGTVLWAASMFKGSVPPIVPFSVGSLGFMTPFDSEHYCEYLDSILHGPFNITLRHRLQCHIIHENGESKNEGPILVLNEVTIDRGIALFLTNLECYCDDSFVTRVQGDGLILSTTSGSTAYSLSAGGSMVHPQVPGILFTPICPHSLSFRPLILPENVVVTVTVPLDSRGGSAWASFDGKDRQQLVPGDSLVCSMAAWPVPTACVMDATDDFLRSIHDNLHWNLRQTQTSDGP